MENITLLFDSKGFTIIKDNLTNNIHLYSDRRPIAYFNLNEKKLYRAKWLDVRKENHIGVFKKKLKNNEL